MSCGGLPITQVRHHLRYFSPIIKVLFVIKCAKLTLYMFLTPAKIWHLIKLRKGNRNSFVQSKFDETPEHPSHRVIEELTQVQQQEMFVFDFKRVATATNNFHQSNKLGQGGFGPVYKVP